MNHHYTSHEEYLYLLAFFEANPALGSFQLPTPHQDPAYYPTRFTPQTANLNIPTGAFVLPENTRSRNVSGSEPPGLSLPSPPSNPESRKPNAGLRSRARKGRKIGPSRRPRSRRAALGLRYSTFEDRLRVLEEDPLVIEIWQEENMVQCGGCEKRIQLDNRRPRSLHLQNWKTHQRRCPLLNK